jgi:hypothetical protein
MRTRNRVFWLDDAPATIRGIRSALLNASKGECDIQMISDEKEMFSISDKIDSANDFAIIDYHVSDDVADGGFKIAKELNELNVQFVILTGSAPNDDMLKAFRHFKNYINTFSKLTDHRLLGHQIYSAIKMAEAKRRMENRMSNMEVIAAASGIVSAAKSVSLREAKNRIRKQADKEGIGIVEWCENFLKEYRLPNL